MSDKKEKINVEELLKEIERLKKEVEQLKKKTKEEKEEKMIGKETVVEILDETENIIKKAFSVLEGAIIGAIEGAKKNLKE
jgi:cell division septum initiation protein DivIVA